MKGKLVAIMIVLSFVIGMFGFPIEYVLAQAPDLAIIDVSFINYPVNPNCTSVVVQVAVKNVGAVAVTNSTVLRLTGPHPPWGAAPSLGNLGNTTITLSSASPFLPNEERRYLFSVSLTGKPPGSYNWNVSIDKVSGEENLDNNWMIVTPELTYGVDFSIVGMTATPSWVERGDPVTIKVTVANKEVYRTQPIDLTVIYGKQRYDTTLILPPRTNQTVTIIWDTSEEDLCTHEVVANVTLPPEDCFPIDNIWKVGVSIVEYIPPEAKIKCIPEYKVGFLGETVEVDVDVTDLEAYWDLAAFDIMLSYDTSILDVVSLELGDFAEAFNLTFRIIHEINETGGYVRMAYVWDFINILPEDKPVPYGSGTLFTVKFLVIDAGFTNFVLNFAELSAMDNPAKWCVPYGPAIPADITHCHLYTFPFEYPYKADVNRDGQINIYDVILACIAYNSRPGDPHWNANADVAPPYGIINIYDVVSICAHYGTSYLP